MKDDTGRCAILLPHGILGRDEEKEIRAKLVETDLLECVIGIGRNLFFNSPMEACIVICRRNKPTDRKGKILFIDAKNKVTRKNAESYLEPHHIEEIVRAYNANSNISGFSSVVDVNTVKNNDNSLTIQMYVSSSEKQSYELSDCLRDFYSTIEPKNAAFEQFSKLLTK